MQKSNLIILSLIIILVVLVASIFVYQKFFEVHKTIKVPSITTNNTIATNSITTTNSVSTTNTITTNSVSISNTIPTNTIKTNSTTPKNITTTIIPTSTQNYTATFLAPNPVSHYFFYIPLSFNSLIILNQTCLGLEKAYYNQSNYATIENLLNSNNISIFSNQGVQIVANYGSKINETINQSNLAYYCVYNNQ